jgi:hypothetical protein
MITTASRRNLTAAESLSSSISSHRSKTAVWWAENRCSAVGRGVASGGSGALQRTGASVTLLPQPTRAPRATIVMPTLPDAGRLGGGPHAGRGGHRSGWPYAARDTRPRVSARVFAVGRGAGFVVLAEVTARTASELRLADGGPVRATVEAPGWPATGLNGTGPGLWRVLRRGTAAHAPNATNLASGSEDAKVRRWNPTTGQPIGQPM